MVDLISLFLLLVFMISNIYPFAFDPPFVLFSLGYKIIL